MILLLIAITISLCIGDMVDVAGIFLLSAMPVIFIHGYMSKDVKTDRAQYRKQYKILYVKVLNMHNVVEVITSTGESFQLNTSSTTIKVGKSNKLYYFPCIRKVFNIFTYPFCNKAELVSYKKLLILDRCTYLKIKF